MGARAEMPYTKFALKYAIIKSRRQRRIPMNRDDVLNLLAQYKKDNHDKYGIENIGLFGSVARDEATDQSDIDICIETKTPDMFMLVHIKEELQNLFHKSVDIVRLRERMNPYLKRRIEKEAIYV